MLMNKLDFWAMRSPLRKYQLNKIITKFYQESFNQLQGKKVLEIGSGSGVGAKLIKKYFSPKRIVAIDLDERMVKAAKRNIPDSSISFEVGDAARLNYQGQQFDAVFSFVTIHHLPGLKWKKCLEEAYRVLKPKGIFFIYEASTESFKTPFGRILKIFTTHPYDSMYTKGEFLNYLKSLKFKILKEITLPRHFLVIAEKES